MVHGGPESLLGNCGSRQNGNRGNKLRAHLLNYRKPRTLKTLKPDPSDTLPSRPYILSLPKGYHQLRTEYSNACDYWVTFHSKHHTQDCGKLSLIGKSCQAPFQSNVTILHGHQQ